MEPNLLVKIEIPYFNMPVSAGFPSPAMDYMGETIDLNSEYIRNPSSTFIIECEGDSMIDAFIPPKSRLLIDKSITAKNGDVVLAVLNGGFTVKYFKKTELKCWLIPANKKYQPIEVTEEMEMRVWGVVIAILSTPKSNRSCSL